MKTFRHLNLQDKYSVWMLILLLTLEIICCSLLYPYPYSIATRYPPLFIVPITILFAGIIGLFIDAKRNHIPVGFSPIIITKLLGNAITPRKLGIFYLLLFMIHLSWIIDGCFNLISTNGNPIQFRLLIPLFIGWFGIICLICFFPNAVIKKNKSYTKLFISGISTPSFINNEIETLNIIPLVRIIQLAETNENAEMIILLSSAINKASLDRLSIKELQISEKKEEKKKYKYEKSETSVNELNKNLRELIFYIKHSAEKEFEMETDIYFTKYGKITDADKHLKFLQVLIKIFALFEFPDRMEWIKKLKISFTDSCDYNNYNSCFKILNEFIESRQLDDENHRLYFNLTPGTAAVSSIMTLLSIDSDRDLYYYSQDKNKYIEESIIRIQKNLLPILDLMSKAMNKITTK